MKIAICGSMSFYNKFIELNQQLINLGHQVFFPQLEVETNEGNISIREYLTTRAKEGEDLTWLWKKKNTVMTEYLSVIEKSDCVLVANYDKKGIEGYIGINTMLEMGVASYLKKPIYLLNKIPTQADWAEEVYGMMPIVINFDLNKIPL